MMHGDRLDIVRALVKGVNEADVAGPGKWSA